MAFLWFAATAYVGGFRAADVDAERKTEVVGVVCRGREGGKATGPGRRWVAGSCRHVLSLGWWDGTGYLRLTLRDVTKEGSVCFNVGRGF